jgi:acetyl esterase/lipase
MLMFESITSSDQVVPLWQSLPHVAPQSLPQLTVHLASAPNGAGVIVCPGGGYRTLASDHEGLQVAQWLNGFGIHAFVLRYRLGPDYHSSVSLRDGKRAVRLVRHWAQQWGLDPQRLGMLGFSAGGHLALATALSADAVEADTHPIDREDCRPNFLVPVYAVTNGVERGRKADEYWPVDTLVNDQTPPTFIVHTHEDSVVPATQATLLYDALLRAGVGAELHIFNHGDHGLGLNRGGSAGASNQSAWGNLLLNWLSREGFLLDATAVGQRCEIHGEILLDGKPVGLGWLSLIPHQQQAPMARVRVTAASQGQFALAAAKGPTPGRHRMVLHVVSRKYPADSSGSYSMDRALVFEQQVNIVPGQPIQWHLSESDGEAL